MPLFRQGVEQWTLTLIRLLAYAIIFKLFLRLVEQQDTFRCLKVVLWVTVQNPIEQPK